MPVEMSASGEQSEEAGLKAVDRAAATRASVVWHQTNRKNKVEVATAPSTILRMVPLPRFAEADARGSIQAKQDMR